MPIASRRQILKCDTLDKDATFAVEVLRTGRRLLGADCVTDVSRKNFLRTHLPKISHYQNKVRSKLSGEKRKHAVKDPNISRALVPVGFI